MLLQQLADYAVRERTAPLSDKVLHDAKRAVVDWFSALFPGTVIEPATLLVAALEDEVDVGKAVLYGLGRRAPLRTAALINGAASHSVEFDDIFRDAIYHPGCPVIAAALAAAQVKGANGELFLRAVIVGYEVSTRIGVAVQPSHYKNWHTTGTIGTFGAAAAVGTILGLDRTAMMDALANAATFASGLQQAFRSDAMSKPMHAGHAAEAGALAALGAGKGVTGAHDVLEGEAGFGVATSTTVDWSKATDGLGTRYNIGSMTIKNHGCCGHTFAAIDGALVLQRQHGFKADDVAKIRVDTYQVAVNVTGRKTATTSFEGKFSLRYVVATALVHGSVRIDAFSPERLADPVVQGMMPRIEIVADPELTAAFPNKRAATLTIELKDGRVLKHHQPNRKGDPEEPLSDADLEEKFHELATPVIGAARAKALLARLWQLERATSVELDDQPSVMAIAAE